MTSEAKQRGPQHDRERGPGLADAQARYEEALGRKPSTHLGAEAERKGTARAAMLDRRQTGALIARGWDQPTTGTFRNHGQRISTMVALAKELGYPASVGALQGNFGTPFETGVATVVVDLEVARAALALAPLDSLLQAEVVRLEASLTTATADLPQGAFGEWATVDLDVTGDSVVDGADLAAAQAAAASGSSRPKAPRLRWTPRRQRRDRAAGGCVRAHRTGGGLHDVAGARCKALRRAGRCRYPLGRHYGAAHPGNRRRRRGP